MTSISPINTVFDRMVTFSRAMDDVLGRTNGDTLAQETWAPALDAWETEHAFVVRLDLPGLTSEQVEVSFDRNTLSVKGSRPAPVEAADKTERRVFFAERAYGAFQRSIRFPQYVRADRIEASFKDGVLTITVPKAEEAKPRKIAIAAA